ncbi:MAG: tRNA (cytidine(34)-2'-O)-methyltransferase [Erysipelotrichaceae bacterium]
MIHIVLYQPEIPQNTGNIIRTAMATGSILHLIKPYGFILDEKHLHRASMDYIDLTTIIEHDCFEDFMATVKADDAIFYLTRYGKHLPDQFQYNQVKADIYLVFGKESTGISKNILKQDLEHCIRLPMVENARSLNLSNTVAIMVYEVLRQLGYPNLSTVEVIKGADYLSDHEFSDNY